MRVLKIHNRYRIPGGERQTVEAETELLRGAGHEVGDYHVQNPDSTLSSIGAFSLSAWNPFSASRIWSHARRFEPDVAHVHNTRFALSPSVVTALGQQGIPIVMTLHNYRLICAAGSLYRDGNVCTECVGSHPWRAVRYGCVRGVRSASAVESVSITLNRTVGTWGRNVSLFIAPTTASRDLLAAGGIPSGRISVVPSSVLDMGLRERPPSASNEVLFVGRLTSEKGLGCCSKHGHRQIPATYA